MDLGTPTAAPPPWFLHRHPEARPVTRDGSGARRRVPAGLLPVEPRVRGRGRAGSPASSPGATARTPRSCCGTSTTSTAHRRGECYCPTSAAAFRDWLRDRYGDLPTLNERWGAAFWSQRYGEWDEIDAPRASASVVNPAQRLDFARFSSDALLDCFRRERDILHELSPGIPVTTNFMANNCKSVDYWRWAPEVDVISNDNYLIAEATDGYLDLAMSADMTRSLAGGGPWLLMEHSTSAVSWQPRNIAKRTGRDAAQLPRARGAGAPTASCSSSGGPAGTARRSTTRRCCRRAGTGTRVWREVVELGGELAGLAGLRGTVVEPDLALLWDWESWWAQELEWRPTR